MAKDPKEILKRLDSAIIQLEEAIATNVDNRLIIDGTIQRFEFTFELFWKSLKKLLAYQGFETPSPRETLQKAYAEKWIDDENLWLQMMIDRNQSSHLYDQTKADEIYQHIKQYSVVMRDTFKKLNTLFS